MILLGLAWILLSIVLETVYADRPPLPVSVRRFFATLLSLLSTLCISGLIADDWRLWLIPAVLEVYRILNLSRFLARRLPVPQLNSVVLRAQGWLLAMQSVIIVLAVVARQLELGAYVVAAIAGVQLLCALVLLRATLHTWRHAEPFRRSIALTDKQLPSLSVLVPARNETYALEACLERLIASDYPKLEIIVLDDASTVRRTPEIIKSFAQAGVRFVASEKPQANWLAKNAAYARLREAASGELLLFCGVDAEFSSRTIRQLVETLLARDKDMLSILPLRSDHAGSYMAFLQPMRYYWELCLPRRFFKRPPVLSTCWLIRSRSYDRVGGMAAVSRSVTPEAYFARQTVANDTYSFIRSNSELGFYSAKPRSEQYETSVRTRYPQLHRRLELVAAAAIIEILICLGPLAGLALIRFTVSSFAYAMVWGLTVACLLVTYYFVAVATRLNRALIAWLIMPFAFISDIVMLHVSLYKYEFSEVTWKGRDVAGTVMHGSPVVADNLKSVV